LLQMVAHRLVQALAHRLGRLARLVGHALIDRQGDVHFIRSDATEVVHTGYVCPPSAVLHLGGTGRAEVIRSPPWPALGGARPDPVLISSRSRHRRSS
jgi:hypothetical protein